MTAPPTSRLAVLAPALAVAAIALALALRPGGPALAPLLLAALLIAADRAAARLPDRGPRLAADLAGALALLGVQLGLGGHLPLWLVAAPLAAAIPLRPRPPAEALALALALALAAAVGLLLNDTPAADAALAAAALAALALTSAAAAGLGAPAARALAERELAGERAALAELRRRHTDLEADCDRRLIALQAANRALERDNLARTDAEARALEAIRTKVAFVANVSHELRTPLNAIIGLTELLADDARARGDDEHARDQHEVLAAAHHLLGIIEDILDLSKIEAGKLEVQHEVFPLVEVIESVGTAALPLARKNNNTIKLKYGRDLGYINTDRAKLRRFLLNLVANACKFTKDGRIELRVDAEAHGDRRALLISVSDTGIGIGHDTLGRLFKPFTQADESSTRPYGGLGLGLAIAKHYAELLGGEITVESRVGEGSVFRLRLPVEPQDPRESGHILVSMF